MHVCIHSSHFYINLYISFIYKIIFTKFAGNVYSYGNMSVQNFGLILKKQNGRNSRLFKSYSDALKFEI